MKVRILQAAPLRHHKLPYKPRGMVGREAGETRRYAELVERLMTAVLKTVGGNTRGFKSYTLRHEPDGQPFWFTPFKAISRTASVPVGLQDSQRRWMGAHLSKRSTPEQRWATSRDRAVVARLAHNQEAVGSSPTPATTRTNPIMCAVNRMLGGFRALYRKQRPPEAR